ncbi:MAG TPA: hypothetical protein VEW66_02075, partial [Thermomicrobiales bacterium]|nr:hypothetical protein [Thermomicrobiales bacterium]
MQSNPTPDQFRDASWDDIRPHYQALVDQPLDPVDAAGIEAWLTDWNNLAVALGEAASLANVAYSCNTSDPALEAAHL